MEFFRKFRLVERVKRPVAGGGVTRRAQKHTHAHAHTAAANDDVNCGRRPASVVIGRRCAVAVTYSDLQPLCYQDRAPRSAALQAVCAGRGRLRNVTPNAFLCNLCFLSRGGLWRDGGADRGFSAAANGTQLQLGRAAQYYVRLWDERIKKFIIFEAP